MDKNMSDTREVMRLVLGYAPDENDVARIAAICHAVDVPRGDPMRAVIVAIYALNAGSARQIRETGRQAQTAVTAALVAAAFAAGSAVISLGLAVLR